MRTRLPPLLLTICFLGSPIAKSQTPTCYPATVSGSLASGNHVLRGPNLGGLKLVTRLPEEIPRQVTGFAYDGEKFWVALYTGKGRYATLDRATLTWSASKSEKHHSVIAEVAGAFQSPGGICFAGGKLWLGGAYGESFGLIDVATWKIERQFKGKFREDWASQSYSSLACAGDSLWIAWHWHKYRLPSSQTQLLLKVDQETGKVIAEYPIPGGMRNDMTHGLTWDGTTLWHMKNTFLSAIDPSSGSVIVQYILPTIKRPSGLAWDGQALWIIEFNGKVWQLPF